MPDPKPQDPEQKWTYGLVAVGIGAVTLLAAFAFTVFHSSSNTEFGTIASPVVAIITAYFGIHASAAAAHAARTDATAARNDAKDQHDKAAEAAAHAAHQKARAEAAISALEPHDKQAAARLRSLAP